MFQDRCIFVCVCTYKALISGSRTKKSSAAQASKHSFSCWGKTEFQHKIVQEENLSVNASAEECGRSLEGGRRGHKGSKSSGANHE